MNFKVVKGFTSKEIKRWTKEHIESCSIVHSDGLNCFTAVKKGGCKHIPYVTGGGAGNVEKAECEFLNAFIGKVKIQWLVVGMQLTINIYIDILMSFATVLTGGLI